MTDLFTLRCGAGDPPLMLVHGWTCDHDAMRPVAEAFSDHASTLVDLLGHGRSPKAPSYAIEAQADAALRVAPSRAIWIGHSMGGQVALAAAVRAPDRVAAVVLLDPAQIAPHEKSVAFAARMKDQLARFDVAQIVEGFARQQILRPTDAPAVERLVATMCATDPEVARAAWAAIMDWDGRAALGQVRCPVLLIATHKPVNRLVDVARLNARVMTAQVAGSGHMLHYEVMDQIAPMIRRFLALNGLEWLDRT